MIANTLCAVASRGGSLRAVDRIDRECLVRWPEWRASGLAARLAANRRPISSGPPSPSRYARLTCRDRFGSLFRMVDSDRGS